MEDRRLVVIGGGVAGLAAGCYGLRSGLRTTIIEHNLALGGVCTAWHRGPYTIDGCIHWLMGGPFEQVYRELGIVPAVPLRTLESWATYRDVQTGFEVSFSRDLDALVARLAELSPEDGPELARMRRGATDILALTPPVDAPELATLGDTMRAVWAARGAIGSLVHFHQPIGSWAREHLVSPRLRRLFTQILPETAPAFFLLMLLGSLEKGQLTRPVGGSVAFRDALEGTYRSLGGKVLLHATVDEVLVLDGRACGVRLGDGTIIEADVVVSTASAPETVMRLLGGRYDAAPTRDRLVRWRLFDPIVLASFGVARAYADCPSLLELDRIGPFEAHGRSIDRLHVRVCNDDPSFAPPDHTVVQVMMPTSYEWWATRGTRYGAAKDAVAEATLAQLEPHFPGLRRAVQVIDLATPLTYWTMARSWRGAYEGWMPNADFLRGHVDKKLAGLEGFYMAGQWVEPGGGVPSAVMSGRQAVQLLCKDEGRPFVATGPSARA